MQLNHIDQLTTSARRIAQNGVKNSLIFDRLQHIKIEIENYNQSKIINLYNEATNDYNEAILDFNRFIDFRNKQFIPQKADAEIQHMIDTPGNKLTNAKTKLAKIKNPDSNTNSMMMQLGKLMDDAATQVKQQQDWLKIYFSKGKSGRKSMFFEKKTTFFGIPIN